jgi:hypothetical protein
VLRRKMMLLWVDVAVMLGDDKLVTWQFRPVLCILVFLRYFYNHSLFCFCNLGFENLSWRRSVPSISLIYCKVTVWLLTFNFIHFMTAFWAVFTFEGIGPAITAHVSLDFRQVIQIQTLLCFWSEANFQLNVVSKSLTNWLKPECD